MRERNARPVVRRPSARGLGLAALCGMSALALGMFDTEAATASPHRPSAVATSVAFTLNLRVSTVKDPVRLLAHGEMDFVHHAITATVTVPPAGLESDGLAKAGIRPGKKDLTLKAEWVSDRAYVTLPTSLDGLIGGASALDFPVTHTESESVDTSLNQSAVALTYAHLLLGDLTGNQHVQHLHARTVDGVRSTGTRADVTLAELLKLIPELSPAMTDDSGAMGKIEIPVTVWVDGQGRLVEVAMASTKGSPDSVTGTVRFSHYNGSVNVVPPPASKVKQATAGVQHLLGGLSLFGSAAA
jgi:hypothetical protein